MPIELEEIEKRGKSVSVKERATLSYKFLILYYLAMIYYLAVSEGKKMMTAPQREIRDWAHTTFNIDREVQNYNGNLHKLEKRGLIAMHQIEEKSREGGKPHNYFYITDLGLESMHPSLIKEIKQKAHEMKLEREKIKADREKLLKEKNDKRAEKALEKAKLEQ